MSDASKEASGEGEEGKNCGRGGREMRPVISTLCYLCVLIQLCNSSVVL